MALAPWKKSVVSWHKGDTLCLSVPFTWLMERAKQMAYRHSGPVWVGSPAVRLLGKPQWCSSDCPDDDESALERHNPQATFTTRGCPNACPFCAVPRIDGKFRELQEWPIRPIVCDNNFFASSRKHIEKVIDSLKDLEYVDFNQGLDAKLFTDWHADQLARLRSVKVRFAYDSAGMESKVADAVKRARKHGLHDLGCYVLIGYRDTPADAVHRLEKVRSWNIRPTPMRYQPLNAMRKNVHVAEGWTEELLRKGMKYYSRLRWFEHIPFKEFKYLIRDTDDGSQFCGTFWPKRKPNL